MTIEKPSRSVPKELGQIIEAKEETDPEFQNFANKRNVILLALVGSYVPRRYNPYESSGSVINIVDEFGIEEALTDLCKRTKDLKTKKVFLLVNSPGGSLTSAFKAAKALREAFDDITVFVPHIAASGGTLLALTGNRIRMGMMSQLSPLDVQTQYHKAGQFVSVNSLLRAKTRLDNVFEKKTVKELPYTFQHMAESIDPVVLEEFYGIQQEGKIYVETILKKSGYTDKEIEKIVDSLIFTLPTHGFVIQHDIAKQMGLKAETQDEDLEAWNKMRKWLSKYIIEESDKHFIRYCIPTKNTKKSDKTKTKISKKQK